MKSRNILKKVATLAIVFALVMSVAGTALAVDMPKGDVVYNLAGGSLNGSSGWTERYGIYDIGFYDWHLRGRVDFQLPIGTPVRDGYAFTGWQVNGTVYPSGTQLTRVIVDQTVWVWNFYPIWGHYEWTKVNVTAQWRELSKFTVTFENSDANAGTLSGATSFANIVEGTSWAGAGIAVPGYAANMGYLFDGWYEGDTKVDTWPSTITGSHTYTARWIQIPAAELDHYKLTYQITGGVGTDKAPASYDGYGEPSLVMPEAIEGYNFIGWTPDPIDWGNGTIVQEVDENEQPIMVTYYEATVTGEYTDMEIVKGPDAYSLLYQGYVNGVVFWPSDVLGASAPPTLGGDPILAGYDFTGWTPGQLDWSTASATVSNQVITPAQGIPYILQTTTYTITITANFTSTGEPEYPLGSPQTGAFDWSGIAGTLAVLSSLGVAFVTRKKEK